jgi:hypothetical protein
MSLSTEARESLEWIRDYLEASSAPESIPMPEEVATKISKHYAEFGFTGQIKLLEHLHDSPVLTLIKILLTVGA